MSKIKNMSRGGWMLIGVVVALLLVPTAAGAATAVYNGIVGTSGHKADVTATGQLKVSTGIVPVQGAVTVSGGVSAVPSAYALVTGQINPGSAWTNVVTDPSNLAVTSINVDTYSVNPGPNSAIQIGLSSNNCASVYATIEAVNPSNLGDTSFSVGTGIGVLSGRSVCAINLDPVNLSAAVFATYELTGY